MSFVILGQAVKKLRFDGQMRPSWRPSWISLLQLQKQLKKWTSHVKFYRKVGVTCHYGANGSKVMLLRVKAAILAAILVFSVSSRIHSCYPPDMHYRRPSDVKSIEKKTITFHAGLGA